MLERDFQPMVIEDLEKMFPGCIVLKNDANYIQGFPDLLILYRDRWAALDTKRSKRAVKRPNQDYYIELLARMSYAAFIEPQNKERVYRELQRTFRTD